MVWALWYDVRVTKIRCPLQLEQGATLSCRGLELSSSSRYVPGSLSEAHVILRGLLSPAAGT